MQHITKVISLSIILLAAGLPIVGAQTSSSGGAELAYTDPKGDAIPFGDMGFLPVPSTGQPTPITDSVDLVSFRLYGEDAEGLYIDIGVNGLKPPVTPMQFGSHFMSLETSFRLDGTQLNYHVRISVPSEMSSGSGQAAVPASFCVNEGSGRGPCNSQRVFASVDWDKALFTLYITKQSLMGQDPVDGAKTPSNPPRLDIGTRITDIRTEAFGGSFPAVFADQMPDDGGQGPYVMQAKAANDRLRLRLANDPATESNPRDYWDWGARVHDFPTAAVSPGSTTLVQVSVENWNSGKRLINLSAEMVDPKAASKFEARIVPTITVPGEGQRVVNLIVNVTGNVEHRESTLLRISARSLGFADELGVMKVRLIAAVPPSPRAKDLFFHVGGERDTMPSLSYCFGCSENSWVNTLEQDTLATSDEGAPFTDQRGGGFGGPEYVRAFKLDAPLTDDLVLNTKEPITATLAFRSTLPFQGTAKMEITAGDIFIGQAEAEWTGQASVQLSFQPNLEAERIAGGSVLTVRVALASTQLGPSAFFAPDELRPEFVAKGSKLTLPIIDDPKPRVKTAIPAGPAFLSLALEGEAEEFVNPGKVRVFRLTLVNEGIQEDVVELTATKDPENWFVDIRPSASFRLKPGESASVGILVKPPAGAKEGEQGHVLVNATSKADPGAIVQAALTAIVTTGVEIDDESQNFTADEDTISHVEQAPRAQSPGAGLLAVALVAGLVAFVRRRRVA